MSIATWKKEFYGSLKEASKSDVKALKHGIRKWTGLLPENLKKHYVWHELGEARIRDNSSILFSVSGVSCALCIKYVTRGTRSHSDCPIFKCDTEDDSPWVVWKNRGNPRPMIRVLKKALKEREK